MFDWKTKLRNKTFLTTFTIAVLAFIYQILGMFDIVPKISESEVTNFIMIVINLLTALGIVVNPNTSGITDSGDIYSDTQLDDEEVDED